MKAYKGFKKDEDGMLSCRGFKYEEGKTYTLPKGERPELCVRGFHACLNPIDVFAYYCSNMGNVEFHEVELEGSIVCNYPNSKACASKITIGRKITPDEMVEISIGIMLANKEMYFRGEEVVSIEKDTKMNYLTTEGKILSETWFDDGREFSEGFGAVRCDGRYNFIGKDGKFLSETWFDYTTRFRDGYARVIMPNGGHNLIGHDGKLVFDKNFDTIYEKIDGFRIVEESGKFNFMDEDFKCLSDTWFDQACNFCNGYAIVRLNEKFNFIGKNGKLLCDQWFDGCCHFCNGFARVEKDGKAWLVRTDGTLEEWV